MIAVVTPEQMRLADAATIVAHGGRSDVLIDRAGAAVAHVAIKMMGGGYGKRVVVICGKGDNGNDGRVAAQRLRQRGAQVRELDATAAAEVFIDSRTADLVIDAAYGIGFHGTWQPPIVFDVPVLAVDLPSGLNPMTGKTQGAVLVAHTTVTFAALKPCHVLGDGPAICGVIELADIGVDILDHCADVDIYVVEPSDVASWLTPREHDAHKWNNGVRVLAGSKGMTGAASLVCAAAMRAGAGIVHASLRDDAALDAALPTEVVQRRLPDSGWADFIASDLGRFKSLVIGPGLGRGDDVSGEVRAVLAVADIATVIDGDGLIAAIDAHNSSTVIAKRQAPTILTPHDGEFAALGGDTESADRIGATRDLAVKMDCTVLRKGPTTIITSASGPTFLVVAGDNRLATAGSGDVLSGVIGALLARGLEPLAAAAGGALIHALAGQMSPIEGTLARDIAGSISDVLSELVSPR